MYGNFLYGSALYSSESTTPGEIEIIPPDLMRYLPNYYQTSVVMQNAQTAIAKEVGLLNWKIKDLENQLFVNKATWGLDIWERELSIYTDLSKSYSDRRENIKARLRGSGTCTKELIRSVAESFSGGEVAVIEDNGNYKFTVQFIGVKGIPQNMQGLIDMLDIIKPAHLAYVFKYTFTVWNMVKNLTWGSISGGTWNDLRIYE